MSILAIIFSSVILLLFWEGFVLMLFYSLRLKSKQEKQEQE